MCARRHTYTEASKNMRRLLFSLGTCMVHSTPLVALPESPLLPSPPSSLVPPSPKTPITEVIQTSHFFSLERNIFHCRLVPYQSHLYTLLPRCPNVPTQQPFRPGPFWGTVRAGQRNGADAWFGLRGKP